MSGDLTIIAHRGARAADALENTMAAFARALEFGATWIELDVQWHDGHLWVFHDRHVDRCTNGRGWLEDHTTEQIERLEVRGGHRIPRLPEVLALVRGRARLNIELKTARGTAAAVAALLRRALADGWKPDDFLVSSFHHPELREFRRLMPEVPIGIVEAGVPLNLAAVATSLGASALSMALEFPDADLIADARRRGLKVYCYTVNEHGDLQRVRDLGVHGVFTDYPERFLQKG